MHRGCAPIPLTAPLRDKEHWLRLTTHYLFGAIPVGRSNWLRPGNSVKRGTCARRTQKRAVREFEPTPSAVASTRAWLTLESESPTEFRPACPDSPTNGRVRRGLVS